MSTEKVWSRFEKKKKDGTTRTLKLRIQDAPKSYSDEIIDLILKYYVTEEPCQKAIGVAECPENHQIYGEYIKESLLDPNFSCVICCPDDSEEITRVLGVSTMWLTNEYTWDLDKEKSKRKPKQWEKYDDICSMLLHKYNTLEKHNLSAFYDDRGLLVVPEYRGLGIAKELLHSRRLICADQGVLLTGAWMSSIGTQIAATRDGWETVSEVSYEDMAKDFGLVFNDAPPTMKYMVAKIENIVK